MADLPVSLSPCLPQLFSRCAGVPPPESGRVVVLSRFSGCEAVPPSAVGHRRGRDPLFDVRVVRELLAMRRRYAARLVVLPAQVQQHVKGATLSPSGRGYLQESGRMPIGGNHHPDSYRESRGRSPGDQVVREHLVRRVVRHGRVAR